MDPSHARRYTKTEIEVIVSKILSKAHPEGISIPVDVDRLVEHHELIDNIIPIELLEDKFNVAAVLTSKADGHFDILVDQDTLDYQHARANFSIAHEFGHISLHSEICSNCRTIEDSIALAGRIRKVYKFIEGNANHFAGAILIPRRTLAEDTAKIYEALVRDIGYDANLIPEKLCSTLAKRYTVNTQPMKIRLTELNLQQKIERALDLNSPYLDP